MVRISVGSPTHHTSGRLYGVFFEDINHGADGGLNANMVNNYSFDGVYLDHHTWRMAGAERGVHRLIPCVSGISSTVPPPALAVRYAGFTASG